MIDTFSMLLYVVVFVAGYLIGAYREYQQIGKMMRHVVKEYEIEEKQ